MFSKGISLTRVISSHCLVKSWSTSFIPKALYSLLDDWLKLEACTNEKKKCESKTEFDLGRIKNIVRHCFQETSFSGLFNPFPNDKFYSSKLKEFADDNFKFDENGKKLAKRVENTVGKGEIARYEQFLLFPQCFQKACFSGASKGFIVWKWVKVRIV